MSAREHVAPEDVDVALTARFLRSREGRIAQVALMPDRPAMVIKVASGDQPDGLSIDVLASGVDAADWLDLLRDLADLIEANLDRIEEADGG